MGKKIHEEIQQKSFRNHHQEVQLNIIFTATWLQSKHAEIFKKHGLSAQQYNVLRILRGSHPEELSLGSIKSRMVDRMSDTSRIVDRLHKTGLVKRVTDLSDRRVAKIAITEKGLKLLSDMDKEEIALDGITENISFEDASILSELLNKLRVS
jgi:DNA-binding MarR family transcriptional regulator